MKKIVFLLFVLTSISCFGATRENYFIKGGLAIASFSGDDVEQPKGKIGLNFGLGASYRANRLVVFEPEVSYVQKGCKFEGYNYYYEKETLTYSLNYLEIAPLLTIKPAKEGMAPFLKFGPYFGLLLNSEIELDKENFSQDVDELFTDNDFGFIIGVGLDFNRTILEARLTRGISEIGEGSFSSLDATNTTFCINFAYKFGFSTVE